MVANKKKVFISDDDMKWFRIIIKAVAKGNIELNNVKLTYKGIGNWNHIKFDFKDIDLRENNI